jgi:hypothetical protein
LKSAGPLDAANALRVDPITPPTNGGAASLLQGPHLAHHQLAAVDEHLGIAARGIWRQRPAEA